MNLILLLIIITFVISILFVIYKKNRKINTIAVLTGAFGYMMVYISLITLSIRRGVLLPIILYAVAILIFVMLCAVGIKANLKKPKVHWFIEISNVICQLLVAVGTIILFK